MLSWMFHWDLVWVNMTHACWYTCGQTNSCLSKQTQTTVILSEMSLFTKQPHLIVSSAQSWIVFFPSFSYSTSFMFASPPPPPPPQGGPVWMPCVSVFPNLCLLSERFLSGGTTVRSTPPPCLPLCSLKRLPQLASFLMMRAECLLLSVLLSKQFPQRGLPPPDRLTQPGTQALLVEEKKRKRDLDGQWMHIYWV